MKGEDRIFLIEAILAISSTDSVKAQFLLNKDKAHRLLAIREHYGKDRLDAVLQQLKKTIGEANESEV
jgi:hypothetical protein